VIILRETEKNPNGETEIKETEREKNGEKNRKKSHNSLYIRNLIHKNNNFSE